MKFSTLKLAFVAVFVLLGTSLAGCDFEENTGLLEVERVGFAPINTTYTATVPDGAGGITLTVELIAPQRSSATTFPVTYGGSAAAGTNFDGPNSVTIAANESSAPLTFTILDGSIPSGGSRDLVITLGDSQDGAISSDPNLGTFTITIAG